MPFVLEEEEEEGVWDSAKDLEEEESFLLEATEYGDVKPSTPLFVDNNCCLDDVLDVVTDGSSCMVMRTVML